MTVAAVALCLVGHPARIPLLGRQCPISAFDDGHDLVNLFDRFHPRAGHYLIELQHVLDGMGTAARGAKPTRL